MNQFLEMLRKTRSSPYHDQALRFATPLYDHFGINHFWYYRISSSGAYTFIGTHAEWSEYCFGESLINHFPCLRHPKVLGGGISLMKAKPTDLKYQEVRDIAWNKFKVNFNLNIFDNSSEAVEAFGFATRFDDERAEERLLNELPLLRYFIKMFRKNHGKLFHLLEENQVNLSSHMGDLFYERPREILIPFERESFLSKIGCKEILSLTSREKQILKLLANGFPASYIQGELHIGLRTAENYIATIKSKLGCPSKVALIQKAEEIASTGWLE